MVFPVGTTVFLTILMGMALLIDGIGSLGAYEAGAYMNSYQKEMKKEERKEGPCSILLQALQLALLTLLFL
jgi:hypothetical protein